MKAEPELKEIWKGYKWFYEEYWKLPIRSNSTMRFMFWQLKAKIDAYKKQIKELTEPKEKGCYQFVYCNECVFQYNCFRKVKK